MKYLPFILKGLYIIAIVDDESKLLRNFWDTLILWAIGLIEEEVTGLNLLCLCSVTYPKHAMYFLCISEVNWFESG